MRAVLAPSSRPFHHRARPHPTHRLARRMKRASDGAAKAKATTEPIEPVWYEARTLADWKRSASIGDVFCSERFRVKGLHVTDRFLAVRRARVARGDEGTDGDARRRRSRRATTERYRSSSGRW